MFRQSNIQGCQYSVALKWINNILLSNDPTAPMVMSFTCAAFLRLAGGKPGRIAPHLLSKCCRLALGGRISLVAAWVNSCSWLTPAGLQTSSLDRSRQWLVWPQSHRPCSELQHILGSQPFSANTNISIFCAKRWKKYRWNERNWFFIGNSVGTQLCAAVSSILLWLMNGFNHFCSMQLILISRQVLNLTERCGTLLSFWHLFPQQTKSKHPLDIDSDLTQLLKLCPLGL